ncbi:hypothetical protein U1Q18_009897 [Sarracenia purpurea var. burkii]
MADLIVNSAAVDVSVANQRLKNAVDSRAFQYQAKDRVIGRGNNLLGSIPVPGRGGGDIHFGVRLEAEVAGWFAIRGLMLLRVHIWEKQARALKCPRSTLDEAHRPLQTGA